MNGYRTNLNPTFLKVVFYIEIGGGGDTAIGHIGSYGERTHALSLARLFQQAGYDPVFVVGPEIAEDIRRAGFVPLVFSAPERGVDMVRHLEPDLVIGCELFNLSQASARGLIEVSRMIGTIDGTTVPIQINTDPFSRPSLTRSLVLPEHYLSFRPCPVNDIGTNSDDTFYWPLFPTAARTSKSSALFERFGLDAARKTVLFAAAPWAQAASVLLGFESYYEQLIERIVNGLQASDEDIDFLFVSKDPVTPARREKRQNVNIVYAGLMPADSYGHILDSCDAIISDNIIQTSVSRAVTVGTPHLIIQRLNPSGKAGLRYNIFPVNLLFPVEREYAALVETAEFDDEADIREKIAAILQRGYCDDRKHQLRQHYVDRLTRMPQINDELERLVEACRD